MPESPRSVGDVRSDVQDVFSYEHRVPPSAYGQVCSLGLDGYLDYSDRFPGSDPGEGYLEVFGRDRTHSLQSFTTSPDMVAYANDAEMCDPRNFGIELTRPARHRTLWFMLQTLGMDMIDQNISRGFHLAKLAEAELRRMPDWEVIADTIAMVTFRFSPSGEDASKLEWVNTLISKKLEAVNIVLVLTARLNGRLSLRMCTINLQTQDDEIGAVVKAVYQKALSLYQGKSG